MIKYSTVLKSAPAKATPLSRIVHVPPCTAELSLQTRGKAFFLGICGGRGALVFLMPRLAAIYIRRGAKNSVLTAQAGKSILVYLDTVLHLWDRSASHKRNKELTCLVFCCFTL
jgi:hypothetical protein